jgi:PKD repeat protein
MRDVYLKRVAIYSVAVLLLTALLSFSLISDFVFAPPSDRVAVTVQTDKAPGQVWLEVFVEGVNITTPGVVPLANPVLSVQYVTVNTSPLTPGTDWVVTGCRLNIIYDAASGAVITVSYSGGYALRETVAISGTLAFDGAPVTLGLVGIQVEDVGANVALRAILAGTDPMLPSDVDVISFYLTDAEGNPKSIFLRGEDLRFSITVKNEAAFGTRDVLVAFGLYDSENVLQGFDYAIIDDLHAGSTFGWFSGFTIPKNASAGNTRAIAAIFTDWPKNNGYPYAPESTVNLTIMESAYADSPTNPVPQQPVENGSYSLLFTLPSDPNPGLYKIHVCAYINGWYSAVRATQFQVLDMIAPPRASFVASPPMVVPNTPVQFDGAYSTAEGFNDSITSYQWAFGDGQTATGKTTSHPYADYGDYTVTLNVTDTEGYWNTTTRLVQVIDVHDVAIISIDCPSRVYVDWRPTIPATVRNLGTLTENFTVTAYFNGAPVGTGTVVNLAPQSEGIVNLQWNTTGLLKYTSYMLTVEASLPADIHPADNTLTHGAVTTQGPGDFNGDRHVDIFDIVAIAGHYGQTSSHPSWALLADTQPNGEVDIFDVVFIAGLYGHEY